MNDAYIVTPHPKKYKQKNRKGKRSVPMLSEVFSLEQQLHAEKARVEQLQARVEQLQFLAPEDAE